MTPAADGSTPVRAVLILSVSKDLGHAAGGGNAMSNEAVIVVVLRLAGIFLIVRLVLGVWLLFGARGLRGLIRKVRQAAENIQ